MADIWFVRAGKESIYAEDFIQRNIVAVGWPELGSIDPSIAKPKLIQLYQQTFAGHSEGRAQVSVSQIIRFMQEIKVGDAVMTHDRDKQIYYLGRILSDCKWRPELDPELRRARDVEWQLQISRSTLSSDAKNTLGAIQTLFLVRSKVATEVQAKAIPIQQASATPTPTVTTPPSSTTEQSEVEREIRAELLEKSEQAIEDRIVRLQWDQVQELVAGILRAMGYRTTVSPRGSVLCQRSYLCSSNRRTLCHAERSEASQRRIYEMFRCAQHDNEIQRNLVDRVLRSWSRRVCITRWSRA